MTNHKVVQQEDGAVVPSPGWEWCSYCNGDGVVYVMDASPDMNEHETECGFCDDGLVPSYCDSAKGIHSTPHKRCILR